METSGSSPDLSQYRPENLEGLSLLPAERELQSNGWQCVKIYDAEHQENARRTLEDIQGTGAEAQITHYSYLAEEAYDGRILIDDPRANCTGSRVWMKRPQ